MPFFPNMPNHQPIVALIPTISTSHPLAIIPLASTSSNRVDKIEAIMQRLMQNIDNKVARSIKEDGGQ